MPTYYCSQTDAEPYISGSSPSFPSGVTWASIRLEATDDLRGELASDWWPFPGVDDSITTPQPIRTTAKLYAGYLARLYLKMTNRLGEDGVADRLLAEYRDRVRRLNLPAADPESLTVEHLVVSAESITLGTDPLGTYEYKLNPGGLNWVGFEVVPESVLVSGYEYGFDFKVDFQREHRGWIFTALDTTNIVTGSTVTYSVDFRKRREIQSRAGGRIPLVRQ